jgi:ectoine hydroxylase-related dioxygenase (phytanoyl-CoA dioxygenase family)
VLNARFTRAYRQDYPPTSISSALVLDDCTVENGPLILWRGSHKAHRAHDADPALGGAQNVRQLGDPVRS